MLLPEQYHKQMSAAHSKGCVCTAFWQRTLCVENEYGWSSSKADGLGKLLTGGGGDGNLKGREVDKDRWMTGWKGERVANYRLGNFWIFQG